jgi:NRAMP (natural resistance-associated macrophage protein)-like metal ion transporter
MTSDREEEKTPATPNQAFWKKLGPGLITGAADDDPSSIATYSQVGARFGYAMLWSVFITFPLMVGIQVVSARIGRVTGDGLAANIRRHYPAWVLRSLVCLLLIANTINLAADIGAMAAALKLLVGGPLHLYAIAFGLLSLVLQIFIPFPRYGPILKMLTLSLFSYVATVFVVKVPWGEMLEHIIMPSISWDADYIVAIVAVFGTAISPYLFFWQSSQEVEEQQAAKGERPLKHAPAEAQVQLQRIKIDTYIGLGFSNLIAFFIMLTATVTMHLHGITDIQTSSQAAEVLRPVAGEYAFFLFSVGIIGTGLLAVPVLAGSAAYAVGESFKWRVGLGKELMQARGFYAILAIATLLGVALNFTSMDPIKALFWSSVINGVIAVPFMAIMMLLAAREDVMGRFVVPRRLQVLGWLATVVMAVAVLAMGITSLL